MAKEKQKSQAQKTAAGKQQKKAGSSKSQAAKRGAVHTGKPQDSDFQIPARLISSVVSVGLFVLFLIMFLSPQGDFILLMLSLVQGLIGKVGFYVAIPALLYLFVIQAFSGKRPVKLRSICLIVFVLICGCLSQMALPADQLPTGFSMLAALFQGGAEGTTAGLICGGIGLLIYNFFGPWLSAIIFVISGLITLLAAFQITIPSIIRAIQNRPRADWEDEVVERQEPAAVVVNHIANKRLEYKEQKRQRQAELEYFEEEEPAPEPVKPQRPLRAKPVDQNEEMMRQIETDVSTPVAAAERRGVMVPHEDIDILTAPDPMPPISVPPVPAEMPPLTMEDAEPDFAAPENVPSTKIEKVTSQDAEESAAQVAQEIAAAQAAPKPEYCFPPIDLLNNPSRSTLDATKEMRENSRRLSET